MSVACLDIRPVAGYSAKELEAANINPQSGLATDYLNHFNEIAMLLEMLPSLPDCAEDVLDWQPMSYAEHFRKSGFQDKELAIAVYELVDPDFKMHFEDIIAEINSTIFAAQALVASGDPAHVELQDKLKFLRSEDLLPLLDRANGMIHGVSSIAEAHDEDASLADQSDIDALFD